VRVEVGVQERLTELHKELDGLAAEATRERTERLRGLQLAARSLRQAESTAQWVQILADAAAPMAGGVQFFRVDGTSAQCEAARGMAIVNEPIDLAQAPALRQAVETRETVVSLFLPSQLSHAGEAGSRQRVHLLPLVGRTRVLAVLLALDGSAYDGFALEVLLSLGAASLELREAPKSTTLIGVAAPATAAPTAPKPSAQSFARRTVARWILDQGDAIAVGRSTGNLYASMSPQIDEARRSYAATYPGQPDYLHDEILKHLALGRAAALGPGYPGATA